MKTRHFDYIKQICNPKVEIFKALMNFDSNT